MSDKIFYEVVVEIDKILNEEFSEENFLKLNEIIISGEEYQKYFFERINDIKWFYPLKRAHYFDSAKAPGPIPTDKEGQFIIPEWHVLPYLERISSKIDDPDYYKHVKELIDIIISVSCKDANGKHIDNSRTWWYFTKILTNLPNERIPSVVIELLPVWLDSKFDTTLQGAEITEKLLPKFLTDSPEDIRKAEKIIESITAIKEVPVGQAEAKLTGEKYEYKTAIDSYWLEEAFKKHAASIGEKCSVDVIRNISHKIKTLLKSNSGRKTIKINNNSYLLTLVETTSHCLLKVFEITKRHTDNFSELVIEEEYGDEPIRKYEIAAENENVFVEFVVDIFSKDTLFKDINSEVLRRDALNLYWNLYRKGTYTSFYESPDYPSDDPLRLLTSILKKIIAAKAKSDPKSTEPLLRGFFREKYLFFPKMSLFIIGQNMEQFEHIFWDMLESGRGNLIMEGLYFGDELKHLLQSIKDLSPPHRLLIKEVIEKEAIKEFTNEHADKLIALWKQKRYRALSFDREFSELYNEMIKITGAIDAELAPAIGKIITRSGFGSSPLTKEQLLDMSNEDIAKYLNSFRTKDFWEGPTVETLGIMLKTAVKDNPDKFVSDLSPFLNVGYRYTYELLCGLKDAWNNKIMIEWGNLFIFIKKYTDSPAFWNDEYLMVESDRWKANHEWVVGMIGELLQDGARDDNWAFGGEHFDDAKRIILTTLSKLRKENEKDINDPITYALNTPFGKMTIALIYLALRISRSEKKKGKGKIVRWSSEFRDVYEKLLKDEVIEAYALLGQYLPQMHYLDKRWAEIKIKKLETCPNEILWWAFMYGYLFVGQVYEVLYKLMQKHYAKVFENPFKDERSDERFVQHVCVEYLRGKENLSSETLFGEILVQWNPARIKEIISFFWMHRSQLAYKDKGNVQTRNSSFGEQVREKVVQFWEWLYNEKFKDKDILSEDDQTVLSSTAKFTCFLTEINRTNFPWLMLAARYVNKRFNSSFFIEYLDKLKNKGDQVEVGKFIAQIFLEMLSFFTPDYDKQYIHSIIQHLYRIDDKEIKRLTDKICNIYGERRYDFLRELYETNRR